MGGEIAIPDEVVSLLESGDVAIWVATASRECVPQTTRSMGARVDRERDMLRMFVPADQGARALEHARRGANVAATFVRIHDYRAVQVKGEVADTRPCNDDERRWPASYLDAFADASVRVGMPRELIQQLVYWPCVVLEITIRELFAQTPGPNAGARL